MVILANTGPSVAQQSGNPALPAGFSFDSIKNFLDPIFNAISYLVYSLSALWFYVMDHPPAAVIASAILASAVAVTSIRHQRAMTRLRETFVTINGDNWDNDVIGARKTLAKVRSKIASAEHKIADYCVRTEENVEERTILQTIMNDYESLALGIRMDILDETFIFRWMRGTLIQDWQTLSPLVNAYRQQLPNSQAYIEFEGLAVAWDQDRSYRTQRKLKTALKTVNIR